MEYSGLLESMDSYMNFRLKDTIEFVEHRETGYLGDTLIRCNNVLYIREDTNRNKN